MSLYNSRGVSAQKEDVHAATKELNKGLFPFAFCKIYPDFLGDDAEWVNVLHADGAGTKSILAYLYWKETGDISVWKGIAQDAIVMNLDDLLCVGIHDNFIFSSTIDRNKNLIPAEVLKSIIEGTQQFFDDLKEFKVNISYLGGETADVGDLVRTITVNGTMGARWKKTHTITNEGIQPGDVIIGLASAGQSEYEKEYNSGIGSNGLTSARHDILSKYYLKHFKETYDPGVDEKLVYSGPYRLTDKVQLYHDIINQSDGELVKNLAPHSIEIGKLLISPTRTYAPILKELLANYLSEVHGLVHCTGGGQTKCLKYVPGNYKIIKDNLFVPPLCFQLIKQASKASNRELYEVFNMGHRMEVFASEKFASDVINLARSFGVDARVVGHVEKSVRKELYLRLAEEELVFS